MRLENDAAYHAHRALSSTKIKTMATSTPRGFWARHVNPDAAPFEPTEAMRQGSLVDRLITEADSFHEFYVVVPADAPKKPTSTQLNAKKPSEATVEAIQFWDNFNASLKGREVISLEWLANAQRIVDVLHDDPTIGPILRQSRSSQMPHFWMDSEHGVECRYKPDLETEDGSLIDLKKGASANPRYFDSQAYKLGYDIQLDHYRKGYFDLHRKEPTRAGFICYEWLWPHDCALRIVDADYLAFGEQRRRDAILKIAACAASGEYPSYGESAMSSPRFASSTASTADIDLSQEIELF